MSEPNNLLPPEAEQPPAEAARQLISAAAAQVRQGRIARPRLVWLELTGCSGNIISLLDGFYPNLEYTITDLVDLVFNNSLSVAEGEAAMDQMMSVLDEEFILAVDGAVSLRDGGQWHIIGNWQGKPLTALAALQMLGPRAKHVLAVGACATHGGPSAARPNLSNSVGVAAALGRPVIQLPGCPCHPDWVMGTLAHLLLYGEPELDATNRPVLFYGITIHDRCPRRHYFDQGIFARTFGEPLCLFKLGCRGPVTRTDCPVRHWNGRVNWPIGVSTCIGCAQFGFPDQMSPFVRFDVTRREP